VTGASAAPSESSVFPGAAVSSDSSVSGGSAASDSSAAPGPAVSEGGSAGGLFTLGEAMGIFVADGIGPIEHARAFTLAVGGAESNVAVGVARLGGSAAWLGRLGPDSTGSLITGRLTSAGVRVFAVPDEAPTGLMIRYRRSAQFIHADYHRAGSAGSRLTPADLPLPAIRAAGILHVTGITPALSATARATVFAAVEAARAAGVPVSFDVNYRGKLWSRFDAAPVLRDLAALSDVVFASPEEAALFVDATDPIAGLAGLGPSEVILKDGAKGCTALIDGDRFTRPVLPVTVIDPVGAGDAFVAGYLAERLLGAAPAQRLQTAIAAGAFAVTVPGDCDGAPTRAELAALNGADIHR
jgi:2-dehydro-3-deoxygluconokinase